MQQHGPAAMLLSQMLSSLKGWPEALADTAFLLRIFNDPSKTLLWLVVSIAISNRLRRAVCIFGKCLFNAP